MDGKVLNSSNAFGVDLLNTPQLQYAARENMKSDSISIVGPRIVAQCTECGLYFIVRIPIISRTYKIEIDGQEYDRWGFATALIQWERLIQRSHIYEAFAEQKKAFRLTRSDRIYNTSTEVYDEIIVTLAQSQNYSTKSSRNEIQHNLQTTNNEWIIVIQYGDSDQWKSWSIVICVVVALCISCLTYVTLVQKHNQAVMKSKTLVQEAKVNIERNMTAYFAHELRNPLCAIDSALLAMPDNLPKETTELVLGMKKCSTFMSSIMNNLLDVRKMEEGKLVMRCEPFSLSKLIANIHAMALPTMKPNVELIQIAETKNRDWVLGDIHRLEQIMYNLVSNSIKYTRVGSVTIYAGWDDSNNVRLECRDTGPGIPKEEQENLFERFTQRGDAPGSGLGLAISKKLVTSMGGSIWFDSDPTQRPGTTCIAVVPLRSCEAPTDDKDQSNKVVPIEEPIRILIVDDIKMNRTMLRRRFEKCIAPNCAIFEASTGEESLAVCGQDGTSFDVIIMDHYMNEAGGVMVGTDAIIALRKMNVQSYIIGCSGNDLEERFNAAGANFVWKKPLPSNIEIIQQLRIALSSRLTKNDVVVVV
jgi:nitrogen-specific signal transduction histidine kinase